MNTYIKESKKKEFVSLLMETKRKGIENVVEKLESLGFFQAPASANRHLSCEGGLLTHSLNVYHTAVYIWCALCHGNVKPDGVISFESLILTTLLHDVCKAAIYKPTIKRRKNAETGLWEDVPGYDLDYGYMPFGHGEKSVIMLLQMGLELTEEEMAAIRWHMGGWGVNKDSREDLSCMEEAKNRYPLVTVLQTADMISAAILEK